MTNMCTLQLPAVDYNATYHSLPESTILYGKSLLVQCGSARSCGCRVCCHCVCCHRV